MKVLIGKSKIEIKVEGCVRCGTKWSSGWYEGWTVPVQIGGLKENIVLPRCQDCETKVTHPGESVTSKVQGKRKSSQTGNNTLMIGGKMGPGNDQDQSQATPAEEKKEKKTEGEESKATAPDTTADVSEKPSEDQEKPKE